MGIRPGEAIDEQYWNLALPDWAVFAAGRTIDNNGTVQQDTWRDEECG
jgi:hypothetical protein